MIDIKKVILGFIVGIIVLVIIICAFILINENTEKTQNQEIENIIIKIENLEYKDDKFKKLNKDNGYIVYDNGLIQEYNNITKTQKNKKQLSDEEIKEVKKQIELVDERKVITINTVVAVTSGLKIFVYSSEGKEIILKDFYSDNYSDASEKIIKILKINNLL